MRRSGLALLGFLLFATPTWAAQNVLTWTDNSNNETNFNIERKADYCPGGVPFVEIAIVGANVTTYTDTAVTEGATYCYRVAASNAVGKSAYSNLAGRTVPGTIPAAPSNLEIVP